MYFAESCGWLTYEPFARFQLPRLVHTYGINDEGHESGKPLKATLARPGKDGGRSFKLPLFRLEWPGELQVKADAEHWHDEVEARFIQHWAGCEHVSRWVRDDQKHPGRHTSYSLKDFFLDSEPGLPTELPPDVAYHLAVNAKLYGKAWWPNENRSTIPPVDVGGLPKARAHEVVAAQFAVSHSYQTALTYLKFLAEGHHQHPFFTDFDTNIREELLTVRNNAVRLYFYMLGDCLYDTESMWWDRRDHRRHWWRLAAYFFWLGRTGVALVTNAQHGDWTNEEFTAALPDCVEREKEFSTNYEFNRRLAHKTGADPCIADEPVEGPVKGELPIAPILERLGIDHSQLPGDDQR